jgi:hypothetical protein
VRYQARENPPTANCKKNIVLRRVFAQTPDMEAIAVSDFRTKKFFLLLRPLSLLSLALLPVAAVADEITLTAQSGTQSLTAGQSHTIAFQEGAGILLNRSQSDILSCIYFMDSDVGGSLALQQTGNTAMDLFARNCGGDAAAINLGGVDGGESGFSLTFAGSGTLGAFSKVTASGNSARALGIGSGSNPGTLANNISIETNFNNTINIIAHATAEAGDAFTTAIGAGEIAHSGESSSGCLWSLGEFGSSNFAAFAHSKGGISRAAVFGANGASAPGEGGQILCDWTGNFGNGNTLLAYAAAHGNSGKAAATVFGIADMDVAESVPVLCNWSINFSGDATIAALGYATSSNVQLATLGGSRNGFDPCESHAEYDGMQFYFNSGCTGQRSPQVVVAALRLESELIIWEESDVRTGIFSVANENFFSSPVASWPRAVALGPQFQLNVGRVPDGGAGPESVAGVVDFSANRPGELCLLGAVAGAVGCESSAAQPGAAMRIDSDWTVNCFGPVRDLEEIEIFNGRLVLHSDENGYDGKSREVLWRAMEQMERNAFYVTESGDSRGVYGFQATPHLTSSGPIIFNYGSYQPAGKLLIGSGQSLIFHLDSTSFGPFPFKKSGCIECLGSNSAPWIIFLEGSKMVLSADSSLWRHHHGSQTPVGFLLVKAPGNKNLEDVIQGMAAQEDPIRSARGCRRIVLTESSPTVEVRCPGKSSTTCQSAGCELSWCSYDDFSGLIVGEDAFPQYFEACHDSFAAINRANELFQSLYEKINYLAQNGKIAELSESSARQLALYEDYMQLKRELQLLASSGRLPDQNQTLITIEEYNDLMNLLSRFNSRGTIQSDTDTVFDGDSESLFINALSELIKTGYCGGNKYLITESEFQSNGDETQRQIDELRCMLLMSSSELRTPYWQTFLSEGLALAKNELLDVGLGAATQHLADVRVGGLFCALFGGSSRHEYEENGSLGNRSRFKGTILGEECVSSAATSVDLVRYGVVFGYGRNRMDFFGPAITGTSFEKALREDYFTAFIALYEHSGAKNLRTALRFCGEASMGRNKIEGKIEGNVPGPFAYDFADLGSGGSIECTRNLLHMGPLQVGPWIELRYDYVDQRPNNGEKTINEVLSKAHGEPEWLKRTRQQIHDFFADTYSVKHHYFSTALGISFEVEPNVEEGSDWRTRLHCRLGWQRQPLQERSSPDQLIYGGAHNSLKFLIPHDDRDTYTIAAGVRAHISKQWEVRLQGTGLIAKNHGRGALDFSINCLF